MSRFREPLRQRHRCDVGNRATQDGVVRLGVLDVAGPRLAVATSAALPETRSTSSTSSRRVVLVPKARLTGSGWLTPTLGRVQEHTAHGPDEGEVARVAAVAVDRQRPPRSRASMNDRDHRGVRVPGPLPRPVDVEEAEGDRPHAEGLLVGQGVLLGRQLRDGVRAHRAHPLPLALGQRGVQAVDRGRGRDDDVADPRRRAASSTLSVPVALAACVANGSSMLRGTLPSAAR